MDRDTLDRIVQLGSVHGVAHEDASCKHVVINGGVKTIQKLGPARAHTFTSLEGFIDYLNSVRSGDGSGIIFVGADKVLAHLDYMAIVNQTASLPLAKSEEFTALAGLFSGVNQKDLWRALLTKLDGCLPLELLLQISNLNIKVTGESALAVERVGLESKREAQSIRVTCDDAKGKGSQTADIGVNWTWKGRIWEAFDQEFEIELTMEIDTKNGLVFRFHPKRLEKVMRAARLALVAQIKGQVTADRFTVHEGSY
jgi:hypothetical protein